MEDNIIKGMEDNNSKHGWQVFKAWMTNIPGMEDNIIQGIDDNYSRHEGQVLKAWGKSKPHEGQYYSRHR